MSNIEEIKDFVTEGYRKVLLREPDPVGFQDFVSVIASGIITKESFLERLRTSEEYRSKFGSWTISNGGIKLIDTNKLSNRPWFFGLSGTWWWGLTEEDVRSKLEEIEKNSKIAIASIVRNEEHSGNLGRFLECCHDLEQYHNNIIYIFVEGDSSDKTYDVLKSWVDARDGSILEKVDKGTPVYPKSRDLIRTTKLGELRNRLIELVLSRPDIAEVLMIDASYGWKGDLITALRDINADIAAPLNVIYKNVDGNYVFYDIWAYRKNGREFSNFYPYAAGMVFDRPVDIDSAGGGYLIRRAVLEAGARFDGRFDVEHVALCNYARGKGFKIRMNPTTYIRKGGFKE